MIKCWGSFMNDCFWIKKEVELSQNISTILYALLNKGNDNFVIFSSSPS